MGWVGMDLKLTGIKDKFLAANGLVEITGGACGAG